MQKIAPGQQQSETVKAFCTFHQTSAPVAKIKYLVNQLLVTSGQRRPPFEPAKVLPHCVVPMYPTVKFVQTVYDAFIQEIGDQYQITVNASQSRQGREFSPRQRFSIAHEVGHTFFLPFRQGVRRRGDTGDSHHEDREEERLCNIAASELLMPEYPLRNALAGKSLTTKSIADLCDTFEVSYQPLTIRVCELIETSLIIGALPFDMRGSANIQLSSPLWYSASRSARATLGKALAQANLQVSVTRTGSTRFANDIVIQVGKRVVECKGDFAHAAGQGQNAYTLFVAYFPQP